MLLLDEPMAGMGIEDSAALTRMLLAMKGTVSMLLVEHDMDAVFALADRISVLVYGQRIATGTPAEIRADPEVRRAYLGDDEAADEAVPRSRRSRDRYGQSQVLFGIDLSVAKAKWSALMGRNGMGKTTTVRSIMGLTRPRRGRSGSAASSCSDSRRFGSPAPAWRSCPRVARFSAT